MEKLNQKEVVYKIQLKFGSVTKYCQLMKISRTRFYQIITAQKGPSWKKIMEEIK